MFQTIIMNSPFKDKVVNDNLRYIVWPSAFDSSPINVVKSDFPKLKTSPQLFARKFDMTMDCEVMDMIDQQILDINNNR